LFEWGQGQVKFPSTKETSFKRMGKNLGLWSENDSDKSNKRGIISISPHTGTCINYGATTVVQKVM
jgi:hypothetical protein